MTRHLPLQPVFDAADILNAVAEISDLLTTDYDSGLQAATARVRQLLQADRVLVYRFLPNHNAVIASESLAEDCPPLQGQMIYDPCFDGDWGDRYRQGHIGVIEDAQHSEAEPCYLSWLNRFQVQANLVVPIFCGADLWALLMAHQCHRPRFWQSLDRQLMQHMARQLGQVAAQVCLQEQLHQIQAQYQEQCQEAGVEHKSKPYPSAEVPWRQMMDALDQVVFMWDVTKGDWGDCRYVSPAYERVWQRPCASLYTDSRDWLRAIYPPDRPQVEEMLTHPPNGKPVILNYRIVRSDGERRWIRTQFRWLLGSQNQPSQVVGWSEDWTELNRLQSALKTAEGTLFHRVGQEKLLRTITAHMRETLDFNTILSTTAAGVRAVFDADRAVIYQFLADNSRRVAQQATRSPFPMVVDALLPPNPLSSSYTEHFRDGQTYIINDVTAQAWAPAMAEFLKTIQVKSVMLAPIVQNFGAISPAIWGLLAVHSCDRPRHWQPLEAEMLQHIADQLAIAMHQSALYQQLQAANQKLDRLSKTDGLTQLANRRWLDDYLHHEWHRQARQATSLSVILADVDYFKLYNDTYGHSSGDQCLIAIAQAIQQAVRRPADLAARYGGEEFAVILPDTQESGAVRVVDLIRHHLQALALPHQSSPREQVITLSFGIATLIPQPHQTFDVILKAADQALYQAKDRGRNQYQVYRPM